MWWIFVWVCLSCVLRFVICFDSLFVVDCSFFSVEFFLLSFCFVMVCFFFVVVIWCFVFCCFFWVCSLFGGCGGGVVFFLFSFFVMVLWIFFLFDDGVSVCINCFEVMVFVVVGLKNVVEMFCLIDLRVVGVMCLFWDVVSLVVVVVSCWVRVCWFWLSLVSVGVLRLFCVLWSFLVSCSVFFSCLDCFCVNIFMIQVVMEGFFSVWMWGVRVLVLFVWVLWDVMKVFG